MSTAPNKPVTPLGSGKSRPFRRAVLRGLAVVMPPLLTIVIFLWAWNTIDSYVLKPIETMTRQAIVWSKQSDIKSDLLSHSDPSGHMIGESGLVEKIRHENRIYVKVGTGKGSWIPQEVYDAVEKKPGDDPLNTAEAYYHRYVQIRYLRRTVVIPVFLCVFILFLYVLGKFLAAGIGRMAWNLVEGVIHRLPIIRNVYSSTKQVTDFVFSEREIQYTRVVAVEYPRKGIWSLGFVTGESLLEIRSAMNEPTLSVLMPTSPMPVTGFTITVPKSETIDLDLTIDQAIQFIVSCGVVVPPHQQPASLTGEQISAVVTGRIEIDQPGNDTSVLAVPSASKLNGGP